MILTSTPSSQPRWARAVRAAWRDIAGAIGWPVPGQGHGDPRADATLSLRLVLPRGEAAMQRADTLAEIRAVLDLLFAPLSRRSGGALPLAEQHRLADVLLAAARRIADLWPDERSEACAAVWRGLAMLPPPQREAPLVELLGRIGDLPPEEQEAGFLSGCLAVGELPPAQQGRPLAALWQHIRVVADVRERARHVRGAFARLADLPQDQRSAPLAALLPHVASLPGPLHAMLRGHEREAVEMQPSPRAAGTGL
jgi:hypothetical protein